MSTPQTKTLMILEMLPDGIIVNVGVVTVTAAKLVKVSNYVDFRDAKGNTVATLTFPDKYRVREI